MLEAIIFDLDGTIIDSRDNIFAFLSGLCQHYQIPFVFHKGNKPHPIHNVEEMIEHWEEPYYVNFINLGIDWYDPKIKEDSRNFFREFRGCNVPSIKKGIKEEVLDRIKKIKGLKKGLVTSSPPDTTKLTLKNLKLSRYFNTVICDDDSLEPKPAPDYILKAIKKLRVNPAKSIYIGDLPSDLQAAKAAGCQTIGVRWGFGKYVELFKEEKRVACSPIVLYDMLERELK